jgi:Tetratricopeptide repeat
VLGPQHPDTALSLNSLGVLLQPQGDLAGAWPYYERALRIFQFRLGQAHPFTQAVQGHLDALASLNNDV